MAKIVIIGAGFAGHTAAMYLGDALGKKHEITVVNKYDYFGFVPSWVWVGIGHMKPEKTIFPLEKVYRKMRINFLFGTVSEVHPDEQFVIADRVDGQGTEKLPYDYLINATGPKLNFDATGGMDRKAGNTVSICTLDHAKHAAEEYARMLKRLENGENLKFVIGTGHPGATCQGAAFEYLSNIHKDLLKRKLRDKVKLTWLTNERALGDFGVRGISAKIRGEMRTSEAFVKEIFEENDIHWEIQKGVKKVDPDKIYWEDYDGNEGTTEYDFAMLIPQFLGIPMKYLDKDGKDISEKIVNKAGFTLVDGIYGLNWSDLADNPDAWPGVYQNPNYKNIFAAGIAFAPPGPISQPHTNPNGMSITAAPPRTGMVSGIIGRIVALNIIDLIKRGQMTHNERMTHMVAACIASMGDSLWDGAAATMVMYPVVPDTRSFPNEQGRDMFVTHMEMGLAGAWMKRIIHSTFMWKFQGRPGWKIIPE